MKPKLELVQVILGHPETELEPMPATICDWPRQRRVRFQFLSPDHLTEMGTDTTALWHAEFLSGIWFLSSRVPQSQVKPELVTQRVSP